MDKVLLVTGASRGIGAATARLAARQGWHVAVNYATQAAAAAAVVREIQSAGGQYVDYAAAKAALDVLTVGLAREVGAEGIRVNAVRPGLIETDIHASGGLPDRVRDLAHQVPMQRGGTADEVAESIVWLLSPAASYTTMSLLEVSGGR
ncbi:MAG: SDR family oxidoreductase [Lysobacteraceae bacterium]|nr:MAG: SDR family oxidoreductase [Xanthomonadaceae bacterium]